MTIEVNKGQTVYHSVYGTGTAVNFYEFYNCSMVEVQFYEDLIRVSIDTLTTNTPHE